MRSATNTLIDVLSLRRIFSFLGGTTLLFRDILQETLFHSPEWALISEQIFQMGMKSLPLVIITAASVGMVMTLQFGIGVEKFGGHPYVPKVVSLSILKEMGPVFTSLMVAARVGAGITSEIGSMMVTQQVDALRALGTSPIQKIIVPRVLGMLIALPLLVSIANAVGLTGALIVGVTELNLDPEFFIQKVLTTLVIADFWFGFGKAVFFAFIISIVSCYYGLSVRSGTKEVGTFTTKSVVMSSILILVGDFFLTKLFWVIQKWGS